MNHRNKIRAVLAIAAVGALALIGPATSLAAAPAWQISLGSHPTNFAPGETANGERYPEYALIAENVGAKSTSGQVTMTVQLPAGISAVVGTPPKGQDRVHDLTCSVAGSTVTCVDPFAVDPGDWIKMNVPVEVASLSDPTALTPLATISGGGAVAATVRTTTTVSSVIAPVGFLPGREGFNASVVGDDGTPATEAGSHPQQLNINLGLPTQRPHSGSFPNPDGTLHDTKVELPAGLTVDPSATEKCTAAEFQTFSCPEDTQVGVAEVPLSFGEIGVESEPIYNLEALPGHAGGFGTYVTYVPVTFLGDVRPGAYPGRYRISALTVGAPSILAVFQARIQLWGSPSDESHDKVRGACGPGISTIPACPVSRTSKPLLSLPTSCTASMQADAHIDLWEDVGTFFDRSAQLEDSNENPSAVTNCNQPHFEPSLRARPTNSAADSPTGLEADLHIPQTDSVNQLSTAHLRKAVVSLPEGMAVNPSGANGLAGCSAAQIGIDPSSGVPNDNPVSCPDASRVGTASVDTPLLDHTLAGSVFTAMPYDNPFDSLLAIYVVVEDPQSGVLAKLAGHVVPDPRTGQLTTTFDESPQLPFEDFKLTFFGGATAALRTPATCGSYSTTSQLTPWSAPESGPPATPSDTWSITSSPSGSCGGPLPNDPEFEAGSASPIAGAYTPFVVNLKRDDATQQFSSITLSLPPGLLAKLAGTTECSDAALAAAAAKSGNAEKASPSCPASSRVGTVEVAAGAGPAPYYTQGTAYLTGPYKGAPLGMAIVTPATAGPYDLGTVVVRTAVHVDPVTTKITAVSDPVPTILDGIPLDIRSARISLDRPDFTVNGTSCEPFSVDGTLFSTQGQAAGLFSRYQLGECGHLGLRPRLGLRLRGKTGRGGFPAVRAVYASRSGDANLKRLVVRFPHSEFIEQGHFRTICTQVQFAAGAGNGAECPAGSVYGHARVLTPLLDETLRGPVYLRSSSHELPDIVMALHGKIDAEVAVRVDSVKGGLRTTVDSAPDVPVSKVILSMQGGNKGLIVNSRNICKHTYRATARFNGQNGRTHHLRPKLKASCGKRKARKRHRRSY